MEWAKTIAAAFLAYLAFTTVAFAQYRIPSESMVPHIEVGDRVTVSKFAYGYSRFSLPFDIGFALPRAAHRLFESMPRRGDVVVFIHPVTDMVMIKRAIGLPGDVIEVRGGLLLVNGSAVQTTEPQLLLRAVQGRVGCELDENSRERCRPEAAREWARRSEETLPGGVTHSIHDLTDGSELDNFAPFTVPDGHVFFMGDNRDNSLDSRCGSPTPCRGNEGNDMGAVPIENLIGRAEFVYATALSSCGRDHTVSCPMDRWLQPLHH